MKGFHLARGTASQVEYAYFYVRAFCRIYLSDYICAGYELPLVCRDMHEEVKDLVRDHLAEKQKHMHWTGLPLHVDSIVPR